MIRTYLADKVTAVMAVQALLAALIARSEAGRASRVGVSMLEAVSYFNVPDVLESRTVVDGPQPAPQFPADCIVATSDGYLALAPVSGRSPLLPVTSPAGLRGVAGIPVHLHPQRP
jgi:crotonobetainyl-CoA:carnitine CoA-transferase CaiB-like acyl-CoA transferase